MPKTTEERLNGQKKAIIDLRNQVKYLDAELKKVKGMVVSLQASITGSSLTPIDLVPEAVEVSGNGSLPVTGPNEAGIVPAWVPSPLCMACGQDKGEGRDRMLTCKDCGRLKADQIKGVHEGAPVKYTSCGHCGVSKKPSFLPVCGKCQRLFQKWRDAA